MEEVRRPEKREKTAPLFITSLFSRRKFLKHFGFGVGSAVFTGLAAVSACKPSNNTTATTGTSVNNSTSSTTTTNYTSTNPTTTTGTGTTPGTTSTGYHYTPSEIRPQINPIAVSDCTVAMDRVYSKEHVWAMQVENDVAVLGVTTTMVKILYEPYSAWFPKIGEKYVREDAFASLEGYKMKADLICPIDGTVLEYNEVVEKQGQGLSGYLALVNGDPYHYGWLVVMRMSKPAQMDDLLTPEEYIAYINDISKS